MTKLSSRLTLLTESETIVMSRKSRELQVQGIDIINLSLGEPDFNTPDHIKAAARQAIDQNITHYPPVAGFPVLRKAIVAKLKEDNDLDYTCDEVMVSNGGKHCIANVLLSIIGEGDEVILPAPYWVSYREMVKLAEGKNVFVSAGIDQEFKITPAQLESAITPHTRVFILNSPSNPTGSVYSVAEIEALAEVLQRHPRIIIISDEIYEKILFEGEHVSIAHIKDMKSRVVIVNGVSKAYAMTGWRIGYMAGPRWIIKACIKLQGQITSGPCAIAQMAALAAITGTQGPTEEMRDAFLRRRDLVVRMVQAIPGMKVNLPKGAFYLFPDVSAFFGKQYQGRVINDANDLSIFLLDVANVAIVAGNAFGAPDCLRFSFAESEERLKEAMLRISRALALLE
ncbi:pyridoxal phosphate-dependent aminotransferase [Marinilabiliaceae bacterium JC017]|nr:pyridoxal phosphate-dependent aminotransferase [Marinilabiliaceae bacterium JC017]